jgi:integrase/recombinase XerD
MPSSTPDPTASRLTPILVKFDGGKEVTPKLTEPPELRHWQIEEYLRQSGKADNTQRTYRGQLVRFAA